MLSNRALYAFLISLTPPLFADVLLDVLRGCEVSVDYLPITSIWKECGIMGGRGPRIQAGAPGGGPPAGGVAPATWAGAAGTGPNSAVIVRIWLVFVSRVST